MNIFHEILINQLAVEGRFISDEGELKKFVIIDAAFNMDKKLIELLLTKPELKQKFFTEIVGHWVFDINLFVRYMENKNFLKDSYTRYRNKIGLTINDKFAKQSNEVALVWPFKDCILEGGQTEEDQKRPEIFFNEILAQEEIDQLTEPKVLVNWEKYTTGGTQKVTEIKRGKNGIIKENLIIKGNNLLALHSLLPQFEEKIKLIYIDPPYNTGNDAFQYNDSFNHSSWLTFMKNRLETARRLLRTDGLIFISIDDREHSYLKILLDEIYGKENFISDIIIQVNKGGRDYLKIAKTHEFILSYQKNEFAEINEIEKEGLVFRYNDNKGAFNIRELRNRNPKFNRKNRPNLYYPFFINPDTIDKDGFCSVSLNEDDNFSINSFPRNSKNEDSCWRWGKEKTEKNLQAELLNTGVVAKQKKDGNWNIYEKHRKSKGKIKSVWDDSEVRTEAGTKELGKLLGKDLFAFPKPEKLIQRILEIGSTEGDIVLDFFGGSGTTGAVAHKMNRQYILIEQMNYIKDLPEARLKKVIGIKTKKADELHEKIEFDTGGISKAVNWKGGGSYIYTELKQYNQTFINQIETANTTSKLIEIWEEMKIHSFLNYNVDIKKHDENIEEFKTLEIQIQKEHLLKLLNKNQLYVNLSSIDDEDFKVSDENKKLTNEFYEIKKEETATQTKTDL